MCVKVKVQPTTPARRTSATPPEDIKWKKVSVFDKKYFFD
jgi:hypothetical protein